MFGAMTLRGSSKSVPFGLALAVIAGCGHPASEAECEAIFERSARIELGEQNITHPATVEKKVQEVRAARGDDLIAQCVGKRVTHDAIRCVENATTTAEIDACLD